MSETGYVYVLSNEHIPKLVKIGYTNRNPSERADELSNFTGVPGKWSVCKYWKLENAFEWEQKIFSALSKFRETGEFFTLTPKKASELIFIFLSNSGAINENGLTNPEKEEIEAARVLHAEFEEKTRQVGLEKQWKAIESEYFRQSLNEAELNLGVSLKEINGRDIEPGPDIFETIGNLIFVICIPIIVPISLLLSLFGITLFDPPKAKAPSVADRQRDKLFTERDRILEAYKNNFFASRGRTNAQKEIQAQSISPNKSDLMVHFAPTNSKQTIYTINGKPHVYDGAKFVKIEEKKI